MRRLSKNKEITIDELLRLEKEYVNNHMIDSVQIDKKHPCYFLYENLFMPQYISIHNKDLTNGLKHELSKWQLTKFEMLMFLCYIGNLSNCFDDGDSNYSPYPINEMCRAFDSVLMKAPKCHEVSVVYRQCRKRDNVDEVKEGEIMIYSHYLSTSVKNWNQDNHQLVIKLNPNNTNGRSLFILRDKLGEKQVTFKRNTRFLIVKIEPFFTDEGEFKRIYMEEL